MKTVTFKSVLHGVARKLSLDPETNLQTTTAAALTEYINERIARAWEMDAWWPWTQIEERHFAEDYDAATAYVVGDVVWDPTEEGYFECILASTGNAVTNATYWAEATDVPRTIALEQAGETVIGDVIGITDADPYGTTAAVELAYTLIGDEIRVERGTGDSVWVRFTTPAPEFTSEEWVTATQYAAGDLVYYATTGECYKALRDNSSVQPEGNAADWELVEFPKILAEHVKAGAVADALREDENFTKANAMEARAEDALDAAFDRAQVKQRQGRRFGVLAR